MASDSTIVKIFCAMCLLFFLDACGNKSSQNSDSKKYADSILIDSDLPEKDPNLYEEFYENGQIKIKGRFNNNQRDGIWESYYIDGGKWSETSYSNGKKNGHTITWYPNGVIRYVGEYRDDEKYGVWKFYNEKGEKVETVEF